MATNLAKAFGGLSVSAEPASGTKPGPASAPRSPAESGVFSRRGDYWTVGLGSARFPVKDIKGLGYIQRLLQHPGKEFHALEMLSCAEPGAIKADIVVGPEEALPVGTTIRRGLSGDAGEMLDAQAKREYQRRLHELNELLEDQLERGNHERAEQIESEIDFLKREIERAVGMGGRDRRTGSNAERARLSVTRAIKTALEKIAEQNAQVGNCLDRSIRTGSFCSYAPNPKSPVIWEFSAASVAAAPEFPGDGPTRLDRGNSFLRAFTGGTAFVGRTAERAMLTRALDQTQGGAGKIVLIGGDAGVGKTRIAAEIAQDASRRGMLTFVGGCYDRDEPVPFIPFVEILEAALAQTRNLRAFREALGNDASEVARLVPQLCRAFPDISTPAELPPEQSRRMLFTAITELVTRVAHSTPSLFLLDDLQWADEGSLLLLNHLAQFVPTMPVMVVGTFRDFELDPAGPLSRTLDELIRGHLVQSITLPGLPLDSVGEMLQALAGREPPEAVVSLFYAETEGNPFFVEELFRHLIEQGRLINSSGEFRRELKVEDLDVPQSLRVVIGRRLAQIADGTLKALGAAAVIGRWFTLELLAETTKADTDSLLYSIEEAETAGLIRAILQYPQARFRFSHELIRQAVLTQLSAARRQRIHLDIADAIERLHFNALEDHANDLAYHLWHAGRSAAANRTARFLAMAARQAIQASAYDQAIRDLNNALSLVRHLPEPEAAARLELQLQQMLGSASMAAKGYAAPEVERAFARARELCGRASESAEVLSVLLGLWAFYLVRANYKIAHELAEEVVRLGYRDPSLLMEGHLRLGVTLFYEGDARGARTHLERSLSIYDPDLHGGNAYLYGQDPYVAAQVFLGLTLWKLGYSDKALAATYKGVDRARQIAHPLTAAYAHCYAVWLHVNRGEWKQAREHTDIMLALSAEHGFPIWTALGTIFLGGALLFEGRLAEALDNAQRGLAAWRELGAGAGTPGLVVFLATLLEISGDQELAFQRLDEAFAEAAASNENEQLSEFYRLKGEMLARAVEMRPASASGGVADDASAESCFLKAIEISQRQEAKAFELRATTSLARLWKNRGKIGEATAMLSNVLGWFTEGLDTVDLQAANALLTDLSRNKQ